MQRADLIFRLRQLSHARWVLVRFFASIGLAALAVGGECFGILSLEGPSLSESLSLARADSVLLFLLPVVAAVDI